MGFDALLLQKCDFFVDFGCKNVIFFAKFDVKM